MLILCYFLCVNLNVNRIQQPRWPGGNSRIPKSKQYPEYTISQRQRKHSRATGLHRETFEKLLIVKISFPSFGLWSKALHQEKVFWSTVLSSHPFFLLLFTLPPPRLLLPPPPPDSSSPCNYHLRHQLKETTIKTAEEGD